MGRTKTLDWECWSGWRAGQAHVDKFASHNVALHDMLAAYDTFRNAADTKALKVIIER
jgi:hypothetical protein